MKFIARSLVVVALFGAIVSVSGHLGAQPLQGQQVSCPQACLADPLVNASPDWVVWFTSTNGGKGTSDCETCRQCSGTVNAAYTGDPGALWEVYTWDAELGEYVLATQGGLKPTTASCNGVPSPPATPLRTYINSTVGGRPGMRRQP